VRRRWDKVAGLVVAHGSIVPLFSGGRARARLPVPIRAEPPVRSWIRREKP
jgi:hypothetical protein